PNLWVMTLINEANAVNEAIAKLGKITTLIAERDGRWKHGLDPENPPSPEWAAIIDQQILIGAIIETLGQVSLSLRDALQSLSEEATK
ncbi:hypothetical protein, partial [Kitasatospora herbaricolor]|uniref:hypothetical protein n=1 Tax=Kitasatospora herbaricolor TaxID=68217 RepID=UPI0036DD75B9